VYIWVGGRREFFIGGGGPKRTDGSKEKWTEKEKKEEEGRWDEVGRSNNIHFLSYAVSTTYILSTFLIPTNTVRTPPQMKIV
jgi:hypothetical protein